MGRWAEHESTRSSRRPPRRHGHSEAKVTLAGPAELHYESKDTFSMLVFTFRSRNKTFPAFFGSL